jgi:hypothetical protein
LFGHLCTGTIDKSWISNISLGKEKIQTSTVLATT